jgi:hypothetical protein
VAYFLTQITRTTDALASGDPPAALTPLALRNSRTVSAGTSAACAAGAAFGGPANTTGFNSAMPANLPSLSCAAAPAVGFSGAAAQDSDGKFAGIALLKPVVVAGPPNPAPAAQAALVPADTVREFLKANGVDSAGGSSDAKAAVVRVICVRK